MSKLKVAEKAQADLLTRIRALRVKCDALVKR